jgi:LysM repeat protein
MGKIARRFKITMAELIAANPSIPNPDSIFPGQVLAVPTPA